MGNVYLAGFMGCGKSTSGPALAHLLGWDFLDVDHEIESEAGLPISRIFEREGEKGFRDRETAALVRIAQRHSQVVALGGGALLREENRQALSASGATIYLRATVPSLADRLEYSVVRRPLLMQGRSEPPSRPELIERIRELLEQRQPIYSLCELSVDTDGLSPRQVAQRILDALSVAGKLPPSGRRGPSGKKIS